MDVDPLELVRWCEGRMACFAVPRDVDHVEALPTNAAERVETSGLEASP